MKELHLVPEITTGLCRLRGFVEDILIFGVEKP